MMVEARLGGDQVSELFHSQGLLHRVVRGCTQVADARCFRRQHGGKAGSDSCTSGSRALFAWDRFENPLCADGNPDSK